LGGGPFRRTELDLTALYRRWPAHNRPGDGFALVVVQADDWATVSYAPRLADRENFDFRPVQMTTRAAVEMAALAAGSYDLQIFVALSEGADWPFDPLAD